MADDADRAQAVVERGLDHIIEAARGICRAQRESAIDCIECGMQIPSQRQIAVPGCQLCIDCASELERLDARARGAGL